MENILELQRLAEVEDWREERRRCNVTGIALTCLLRSQSILESGSKS